MATFVNQQQTAMTQPQPMGINFNFDEVDEAQEFSLLPQGKFLGVIIGCEEKPGKEDGLLRWVFKIEVTAGKYAGEKINDFVRVQAKDVQDQNKIMSRIKALFQKAGIQLKGQCNIHAGLLISKTIGFATAQDYYTDEQTGQKKVSSNIKYASYFPASEYKPEYDENYYSLPAPEETPASTTSTTGGRF